MPVSRRTELDWILLEHRERSGTSVPTLGTGVNVAADEVRIGLTEGGGRRLLIPIQDNTDLSHVSSGAGLELERTVFEVDARVVPFADLLCLERELNGVFADVADAILDRIQASPDVPDVPDVIQQVLDEFRRLIGSTRASFSRERLAGALGEMLLAVELVELSSDAVRYWSGPDGTVHDFMNAGVSAEVKATATGDGRYIQISSLEQLEAPENGELWLVVYVLREVPGGDISCARLIDRMIHSGVSRELLESRLDAAAIPERERDSDTATAFGRIVCNRYRVEESFPRLTRTNLKSGGLPAGIRGCQYTVDLSEAEHCRVQDTESCESFLRKLAGL